MGDKDDWEMSVRVLEEALTDLSIAYNVDEGGGAFYGPKIDLKIIDSLGREWQMSTIQFDFNLPSRFKMTYIAKDGKERQPFLIHRALLGSIERFFWNFGRTLWRSISCVVSTSSSCNYSCEQYCTRVCLKSIVLF